MNKINVLLEIKEYFDEQEYKYDVSCYGEKNVKKENYQRKYISSKLIIDDKPINFYFDYTSLLTNSFDNRSFWEKEEGFIKSEKYSYFYPLSCACGEPGCNNIGEGVKTEFNKEKMTWYITDKTSQKAFGVERLDFNRSEYDLLIKKIWKFLHSSVLDNPQLSEEEYFTVSEYLMNVKMKNPKYFMDFS